MAKYEKSKTYWKKQCDSLFAKIVRSKGRCVETNSNYGLQCAHIISRSYPALRWDFKNAVCLSIRRHAFYTFHPVEWKRFINKHFGAGYYEMLEERALERKHYSLDDLKEIYARLKDTWDSLNRRNE